MRKAAIRSESKAEVIYESRVRVEAMGGGVKLVHLPMETHPVPMGMHGPIAEHYKIPQGTYTPHASTLDYIVGATAACLMGTLSRALQVRKIATDGDRFQGEAIGELEVEEDGILVIRRIRMLVRLRAEESQREAVERVIKVYASQCPVHRSLSKAIDITTELEFQPIIASAAQ